MFKFFNTFARARSHIAKRFRKDHCLFYGYQANVAMLLYDRGYIEDIDICNAAAIEILELVFFDKRGARSKPELNNVVQLSRKTGITKISR